MKSLVDQLQRSDNLPVLPNGYRVERLGFQKNALYLGDRLLKVYESSKAAHNATYRHQAGGDAHL
jgi:hypothetical protein